MKPSVSKLLQFSCSFAQTRNSHSFLHSQLRTDSFRFDSSRSQGISGRVIPMGLFLIISESLNCGLQLIHPFQPYFLM